MKTSKNRHDGGAYRVVPEYKLVNCSDHRKKKRPDTWQTGGARSAKTRSKTAPGIGKAMSEQWGGLAT